MRSRCPQPAVGVRPPRRPKDWKEHLRQLVSILAGEEGAPDGQVPVPLDTDMSRRMIEVKAAALRVLRFITVDHERVAELGHYRGFQVCSGAFLSTNVLP